jgi:hypothetical protein
LRALEKRVNPRFESTLSGYLPHTCTIFTAMWNFVLRILHWFVVSIAFLGAGAAYGQGRPAGAGNPQEGRIYGKVLEEAA